MVGYSPHSEWPEMYRDNTPVRNPVSMEPLLELLELCLPELESASDDPRARWKVLAAKILEEAIGNSPRHKQLSGGLIDIAYVIRDALWYGHVQVKDDDEAAPFDLNAAEQKAWDVARQVRDVLVGRRYGVR